MHLSDWRLSCRVGTAHQCIGDCRLENSRVSKSHDRLKRKLGDFAVPCMVTERWLQFSTEGSARLVEGEYITLSVMTCGADDQPKKLCGLIVTREDLLAALELIEKPG